MMRRRRAAEQTEHEAAQGTAGAGEGVEPAAEERGEDDVVSDRRGDGAGGRRQARGQENEDDGQGRREGKGRGQGQRGRTETQKTWVNGLLVIMVGCLLESLYGGGNGWIGRRVRVMNWRSN